MRRAGGRDAGWAESGADSWVLGTLAVRRRMIAQDKRDLNGATKRLADGSAREFEESLAQMLTGKGIPNTHHERILGQFKCGCATEPGRIGARRDPLSDTLKGDLPDLSRIRRRAAARSIQSHTRRSPMTNSQALNAFLSVSLSVETVQTPWTASDCAACESATCVTLPCLMMWPLVCR